MRQSLNLNIKIMKQFGKDNGAGGPVVTTAPNGPGGPKTSR